MWHFAIYSRLLDWELIMIMIITIAQFQFTLFNKYLNSRYEADAVMRSYAQWNAILISFKSIFFSR